MDTGLPRPDGWLTLVERAMRSMDLQMGLMTKTKERGLGEFEGGFGVKSQTRRGRKHWSK